MLEGVQLQRLGRCEAGVRRQTKRFPDHRLAAVAYEDRSVVRFEFIHASEALVVLFHSAAEPKARVENQFYPRQWRLVLQQRIIASQRPYIGSVEPAHHFVHSLATAGDVVDDKRAELFQCPTGYLGSESIDGQLGIGQGLTECLEGGFETSPFFVFGNRHTTRTGGASPYIEYVCAIRQSITCPSDHLVFIRQPRTCVKTVGCDVTYGHNLPFHGAKVQKKLQICKKK